MKIRDFLFKTTHGKYAYSQAPNKLLWASIFLGITALVAGVSSIGFISLATLGVWAVTELVNGVNRFRQILGFVVIACIFFSIFYFELR